MSSVYLDTSCLLKMFFPEPETEWVLERVQHEDSVIVSDLTRLEMISQVHARVEGGSLSRSRARTMLAHLDQMLTREPFELVAFTASALEAAEQQARQLAKGRHCRTLDRLHLTLLQEQGINRLLTNDEAQARAARALGLQVIVPRAKVRR
jgi:predicted nucleic acid-binding protein